MVIVVPGEGRERGRREMRQNKIERWILRKMERYIRSLHM